MRYEIFSGSMPLHQDGPMEYMIVPRSTTDMRMRIMLISLQIGHPHIPAFGKVLPSIQVHGVRLWNRHDPTLSGVESAPF